MRGNPRHPTSSRGFAKSDIRPKTRTFFADNNGAVAGVAWGSTGLSALAASRRIGGATTENTNQRGPTHHRNNVCNHCAKATVRCRAGALAEADDHGVYSKKLGRRGGSRVAGLYQMMIEVRLVSAADRPALVEILMNSPNALAGHVRAWQ